MARSAFWLDLKVQFSAIHEPLEPLRAEMGWWDSDDPDVVGDSPGARYWRLLAGDGESRDEFKKLAGIGAEALRPKAEMFEWLFHIRENRVWADYQISAWRGDLKAIGFIPDVLVASMRLCTELALSKERRQPGKVVDAKNRRAAIWDQLRQKHWSLEKWADFAGVEISRSALSEYLNGKRSTFKNKAVAAALAKALDLPSLPE